MSKFIGNPFVRQFCPWIERASLEIGVKENTTYTDLPRNSAVGKSIYTIVKTLTDAGEAFKSYGIEVKENATRFHNSSKDVEKYYTKINVWGGKKRKVLNPSDEVPWCAAFVNWCLEMSGVRGNRKANAKSFESYGYKLPEPMFGCIAVVPRGGNRKHVAFFVGESKADFALLGGNQKDRVSISKVFSSNGATFIWPTKPPTKDEMHTYAELLSKIA
ncbi:MAG: TIGR02594 family protein [Pseudomonadota bacterium]